MSPTATTTATTLSLEGKVVGDKLVYIHKAYSVPERTNRHSHSKRLVVVEQKKSPEPSMAQRLLTNLPERGLEHRGRYGELQPSSAVLSSRHSVAQRPT